MPAPTKSYKTKVPAIVGAILWVDCSGAIFVGALMLGLSDWLLSLFQLPSFLYFTIAAANLAYGTFSFVLASLNKRPVSLVSTLAIANAIWGCVCLISMFSMIGRASIFGLSHILLEGVVVFSLARIEWRYRAFLAAN